MGLCLCSLLKLRAQVLVFTLSFFLGSHAYAVNRGQWTPASVQQTQSGNEASNNSMEDAIDTLIGNKACGDLTYLQRTQSLDSLAGQTCPQMRAHANDIHRMNAEIYESAEDQLFKKEIIPFQTATNQCESQRLQHLAQTLKKNQSPGKGQPPVGDNAVSKARVGLATVRSLAYELSMRAQIIPALTAACSHWTRELRFHPKDSKIQQGQALVCSDSALSTAKQVGSAAAIEKVRKDLDFAKNIFPFADARFIQDEVNKAEKQGAADFQSAQMGYSRNPMDSINPALTHFNEKGKTSYENLAAGIPNFPPFDARSYFKKAFTDAKKEITLDSLTNGYLSHAGSLDKKADELEKLGQKTGRLNAEEKKELIGSSASMAAQVQYLKDYKLRVGNKPEALRLAADSLCYVNKRYGAERVAIEHNISNGVFAVTMAAGAVLTGGAATPEEAMVASALEGANAAKAVSLGARITTTAQSLRAATAIGMEISSGAVLAGSSYLAYGATQEAIGVCNNQDKYLAQSKAEADPKSCRLDDVSYGDKINVMYNGIDCRNSAIVAGVSVAAVGLEGFPLALKTAGHFSKFIKSTGKMDEAAMVAEDSVLGVRAIRTAEATERASKISDGVVEGASRTVSKVDKANGVTDAAESTQQQLMDTQQKDQRNKELKVMAARRPAQISAGSTSPVTEKIQVPGNKTARKPNPKMKAKPKDPGQNSDSNEKASTQAETEKFQVLLKYAANSGAMALADLNNLKQAEVEYLRKQYDKQKAKTTLSADVLVRKILLKYQCDHPDKASVAVDCRNIAEAASTGGPVEQGE